jgi:hypothetical protein
VRGQLHAPGKSVKRLNKKAVVITKNFKSPIIVRSVE